MLIQEPEKVEVQNFQRKLPTAVLKRWETLVERAKKQRVNLYKAFDTHFPLWLDEVEAELNALNVRPMRTRAE